MLDSTQPPSGISSSDYPGPPPLGATRPPAPQTTLGIARPGLRIRIANWMERTFGRAYLPVAMITAGALGAAAGTMALGAPVGTIAGGAAGALLGGVLVFAG